MVEEVIPGRGVKKLPRGWRLDTSYTARFPETLRERSSGFRLTKPFWARYFMVKSTGSY